MSTPYYVTSCKRSDGWAWQVRTGGYPSATVKHVSDSAVAAHVWAEGRGYTLLNPATCTPTPTERLGQLVAHAGIGVSTMRTRKLHATHKTIGQLYPVQGYGDTHYSRGEEASYRGNGWWTIKVCPLGKGAPFRARREAL